VGAKRAAKDAVKRSFAAVGLEIRRRRPPPTTRPKRAREIHATLASHVQAVLERQGVDCVVDVGAYKGQFAELVRSAGWQGRIASFEPVTDTFRLLEARAAGDPDWTVRRIGLGRASERRLINVMVATDFSSFLPPSEAGSAMWPEWTQNTAEEEVEVRRLDEVLDDVPGPRPQRVYLKLDTQGFDLEVFAGAAGVLDRIVALQSEVSVRQIYAGMPSYLEALATYQQAGFDLTGLYPVTRDPQMRIVEYDAVMIRV
jgi:FkbM family methyltransferase